MPGFDDMFDTGAHLRAGRLTRPAGWPAATTRLRSRVPGNYDISSITVNLANGDGYIRLRYNDNSAYCAGG